ncbi:TupA-like ATPgrasp [Evansella caseinilytica]|uniref:TupA-like ATPgrasp n=1 Tax=Evansella caseinilytica TaxID=1503961 RepID=A0A1H3U0Z5_9BACI|nr:ATP-grasp fold amidoligase family protein [Evansella caseinilytica]SDZ55555.1 TupA-like ATPgrasp [Evansella caseinilytica]
MNGEFRNNHKNSATELWSNDRLVELLRVQEELQELEKTLVATVLKKEAQLKKLQQENKKVYTEIKSIELSKKWRYSRPLRELLATQNKLAQSFKYLSRSGNAEKARQCEELQEENFSLKNKLKTMEAQWNDEKKRLNKSMPASDKLTSDQLRNSMKSAKKDGNIIEAIDSLIEAKALSDNRFNDSLKYAAKLFKNEKREYKHLVYNKVLSGLKIEEIPEFLVRTAESESTVSLKQASSFNASLTVRSRKRQLGGNLPEWLLDHKIAAYRFIDDLEIKRPWISDKVYNYTNIPKEEGIVIKPVDGAGSRGVYLVFTGNNIKDIKRGRVLEHWDELKESMEEDLDSLWVEQDRWMTEELMMEDVEKHLPARDLKFYCFYGKVPLILEIERFPEVKYCWWTKNGERIKTGKYENQLFSGKGFSQNELELAAFISSEIPAPFIRIDFLKTNSGVVFGEFTPKPGNYDEFNKQTDNWLGDCFLDAELRLAEDLLNGKQFFHYKNFVKSL